MIHFSTLWQAAPQDETALNAFLLRAGLCERIKPAIKKKKWGAPRDAEPQISTRRALQIIEALARAADERGALLLLIDALLLDLSHSADPFRALLNFSRLCDNIADKTAFFAELQAHPTFRHRLCNLLGFSQSLADTLERQTELLELLRHKAKPVSRPQLRVLARAALNNGANRTEKMDALRRFRRAQSFRIGVLDLDRQTWRKADDFTLVVRQISDLAQVIVQSALEVLSDEFDTRNFAVLGMGKLGARELNYWSDLDLIFINEGDSNAARELGEVLLKELNASTAAGTMYRVDMRLRPEGAAGPLVTPMGYALGYYESFAAAWEWQALIKCRALAGDAKLARRFRKFTRAITWAKRPSDDHLRAVVEMKKRSEATPEGSDDSNVKQGPGAIRDAEWIVQQLQMMVGPEHKCVRVPDTLSALRALENFGALTEKEARELRDGYLFFRVVEHRLQLLDERAIRTLPGDENERIALARRLGYASRTASAAQRMNEDLTRYRSEIRALCERLFWGWKEMRNARVPSGRDGVRGDNSALQNPSRPEGTRAFEQRLQRIAHGSPTRPFPAPLARQIEFALSPVLRHLDHAANPERALNNLERLCEASGNRLSLLRSLGEAPEFARAVFAILGGASLVADTLISQPELLDLAAQRPLLAEPKSWGQAWGDCRSYCLTFRDRKAALRRWKKREMLRIALRDLAIGAPPHEITAEIADLARACLSLSTEEAGATLRPHSDRLRFAVLGMGKLGGGEMHYASDCDVIFAYEAPNPWPGAAQTAANWAREIMKWMNEPTEDGTCFEVDARLRPHGQSGALALPLSAFYEYFENAGTGVTTGIAVWERQALTRARYAAGDAEIAATLLAATRHVAFPAQWRATWSDELRHIKGRVETERGAKSAKSAGRGNGELFDVKLGPGALSDIEWCAQWLALSRGAAFSPLQTTNTRGQIEAARAGEFLSDAEAAALLEAHTFLRRAELRLQLTQEHGGHAARSGTHEFAAWSRAVFPDEPTEVAEEKFAAQWHGFTQKSRAVMQRVRDEL